MITRITKNVLPVLLISLLASACTMDLGERGNGQIVTEEYDVDDFSEVYLSGNFEVVLRESNQPNLILITDENLVDYIEVESGNGQLEINSRRKLRPSDDSKLIIEYTELEKIDVSGAAQLSAENIVRGNSLDIQMSGAGEVELRLDLQELGLDISGAGAVQLEGFARRQTVSLSGAGGYDGNELESEYCRISISGVGGAEVFVTDELDASVSGVGGVSYRGNPANVNRNVSGLGSIDSDDDGDSM